MGRMSSVPTPDKPPVCILHVEDFPADLKQQAKARAALEGRSLREWLSRVVTTALSRRRA